MSKKLLLCVALQVVLFSSSLLSANALEDTPAPVTITEIKIVGNHLISADKITSAMCVHKGDLYSRDKIMDDLKAICLIGYLDGSKLEINPELIDSGVILTIKVAENPVIKRFIYKGNTKIREQDLDYLFAGQQGLPQNIDLLSKAIDSVEQWYHSRGYVLAKVADVKDDPDGTLHIIIDEGKLSAVEITGVDQTEKTTIERQFNARRGQIYNENDLIKKARKMLGSDCFDIKRSIAPDKKGSYILQLQFYKGRELVSTQKEKDAPDSEAFRKLYPRSARLLAGYQPEFPDKSADIRLHLSRRGALIRRPILQIDLLLLLDLHYFRNKCSAQRNSIRSMDFDHHPILKTPLLHEPGRSNYQSTPIRDFVENPLPIG